MKTSVKIWAGIDMDGRVGIFKGPTPAEADVSGCLWNWTSWKLSSLVLGRGVRRIGQSSNWEIDKKATRLLKKFTGISKRGEVKELTLRRCYEDEKPMLYIFRNHTYYVSLGVPCLNSFNKASADLEIGNIYHDYYQDEFPKGFYLAPREYIELVIEPIEVK